MFLLFQGSAKTLCQVEKLISLIKNKCKGQFAHSNFRAYQIIRFNCFWNTSVRSSHLCGSYAHEKVNFGFRGGHVELRQMDTTRGEQFIYWLRGSKNVPDLLNSEAMFLLNCLVNFYSTRNYNYPETEYQINK